MNKLLLASAIAAFSGLSGLAVAQEVGKVISSTPVLKRVTEPRSNCGAAGDVQQRCRTETVSEDRTIGYKVVYEYAGKQHTVQLPFPPGATIELEVTPAAQTLSRASSRGAASAPQRVYVERDVERSYREPIYSEPAYSESDYYPSQPYYSSRAYDYPSTYNYSRSYDYPGSYYYPRSYASPIYPLLGVALGYSWGVGRGGYWGHGGHRGHRGHIGHIGHWGHGGSGSHRGR